MSGNMSVRSTNKNTKTNAKAQAEAKKKAAMRLNMRNPPSIITGLPPELFDKYSIEIEVTGPKTITHKLRELDDQGLPGRYLDFAEVEKLCRAPGFVRAQDKNESRDEIVNETRAVFYNTGANPKKAKDPKASVKLLKSYQTALDKVKESLTLAGDSEEDKAAAKLAEEVRLRGIEVANETAKNRIMAEGLPKTNEEIMLQCGFPASLRTKFLTEGFEVMPQSKFWTSLYGKDLSKFSNISVREIRGFSKEKLLMFYDAESIERLRKLTTDLNLAVMCGRGQWDEVPAPIKEKILNYGFPIKIPIRRLEIIRRYEANKSQSSFRNLANSPWKPLDEEYNGSLDRWYCQAPVNVAGVKTFWSKLAGTELLDPMISSKSYRVQAIENLAKTDDGKVLNLTWPSYTHDTKTIIVGGVSLQQALIIKEEGVAGDGSPVTIKGGFENYHPFEIVGRRKEPKKKDRERMILSRKHHLTKRSKRYWTALKKRGIHEEVLKDLKSFLENFHYLPMQEMAAHIVYMTCEISVKKARAVFLDEEDPPSDEDDEGEEEKNDGDVEEKEDEEDNEPLDEPLKEV